jgi:hypothetical protein
VPGVSEGVEKSSQAGMWESEDEAEAEASGAGASGVPGIYADELWGPTSSPAAGCTSAGTGAGSGSPFCGEAVPPGGMSLPYCGKSSGGGPASVDAAAAVVCGTWTVLCVACPCAGAGASAAGAGVLGGRPVVASRVGATFEASWCCEERYGRGGAERA